MNETKGNFLTFLFFFDKWVQLIVVSFYSRHIYPLSQKAQDYPGLKRTRLNFKIRIAEYF